MPIVLAITGASGAIYSARLLEVLLDAGREVHLTISPSGAVVLKQELGLEVNLDRFELAQLLPEIGTAAETHIELLRRDRTGEAATKTKPAARGRVVYHHHQNFMAPIASGSFLTEGMVVCPASGSTISAIVHGSSTNLTQRAADVHLKERRKLILMPRETPLSELHLDNLRRAAQLGAVVLPAMPGWYHGVSCLQDLVDFIVARILDQLNVEHQLMRRWGS